MALTSAQITLAFQNVLQRDPSAAELSAWLNASTSGALTDAQVYAAIVNSAEALNGAAAIIRVYQAAFGRVPDKAGLDQQTDSFVRGGFTINKIAEGFVVSQEFANKYNGGVLVTDNAAAVTDALLQALYTNVLGRLGSAAELAAWKATLTTPGSGYTKASDVLIGFSQSPEFVGKAAAAVNTFLTAAAQGTAVYAGALLDPAAGSGSTYTLTTNIDTFTGTAGADTFDATKGAAGVATLTGLDSIDGGEGTDTLKATQTGALTVPASATVKNVENLELTTDNAITADVQNWTGLLTVKGVAGNNAVAVDTKANVTSVTITGGAAVAIDDKNATAGNDKLTTVSVTGNQGALTIASDALTKLTVANTNQNATITAAAGARTLDLTLDKITGGVTTDAEATALKVTASGTASTGGTLTFAKATKIDVGGDKALSTALGAQAANLVITSTNSAGTTITSTLNNDVVFTGGDGKDAITIGATTKTIDMGKGDDKVTVGASALGAGGSVAGGEGTDTVSLSAADAYTASGATTFAAAVKGFEVLEIGATAGAGEIKVNNLNNASNNAIAKVVAAGAIGHAVTISGIVSGNTVEFKAGNTAATTLTVTNAATGTADVINIGITNNAGINVNTVSAADIETVNILSDDSATTPTGIAHTLTLTATAAKTVTVTGDAGVTLGTIAGNTVLTSFDASGVTKGDVSVTTAALAGAATLKGGAGNDTINASAATKAVTIEGGAGNDTITGSSTETNTINGGDGNDTIVGGAKVDTINAGAGNDTITSGKGLDIIDVGAGDDTFVVTGNDNGNTYATLTGMGKGDKIDFADKGTATFTTAKITLADTALFADFLNAAAAGDGSTNGIVTWFQFQGNTYIMQDVSAANTFQNGAAADQVVKLTGVVDLSTATIAGATSVITLG